MSSSQHSPRSRKKRKRSLASRQQQQQQRASDAVLIITDDNAESMDVTLTGQIFRQLGMTVVHAGRQSSRPVQLTKNVSLRAQLTFKAAKSRRDWKVLVLPGGNRAMERLMHDENFLVLLQTHVEKRQGLVAAMGAFCVHGLPSLKYIDPLGPTCYPTGDLKDGPTKTTVVMREGNIWTAPGLGTATELALTLGEYLYGHREARHVAKSIGYVPGDWYVDKLRDVQSNHQQQDAESSASISSSSTSSLTSFIKPKQKQLINSGFWETIWPTLSDQGWYCDFEDKRRAWIFWRPGCDQKRGRKDADWFESSLSVLQYLSNDKTSCCADLMSRFDARVAEEQDKVGVDAEQGNAQWNLFHHVVWRRLEAMGWRRIKSSSSLNQIYCTPDDQAKLESPEDVLEHLLADEELQMQEEILYIVDLYRQCELTNRKKQANAGKKHHSSVNKSPAAIEAETKRQVPALSIF